MTALTLPGISIRLIQDLVAHRCDVPIETMRSPTRKRKFAWPRQLAMALSREFTAESLNVIGHHFGDRDHSTIWAACHAVETRAAFKPDITEHLRFLRALLIKMTPKPVEEDVLGLCDELANGETPTPDPAIDQDGER